MPRGSPPAAPPTPGMSWCGVDFLTPASAGAVAMALADADDVSTQLHFGSELDSVAALAPSDAVDVPPALEEQSLSLLVAFGSYLDLLEPELQWDSLAAVVRPSALEEQAMTLLADFAGYLDRLEPELRGSSTRGGLVLTPLRAVLITDEQDLAATVWPARPQWLSLQERAWAATPERTTHAWQCGKRPSAAPSSPPTSPPTEPSAAVASLLSYEHLRRISQGGQFVALPEVHLSGFEVSVEIVKSSPSEQAVPLQSVLRIVPDDMSMPALQAAARAAAARCFYGSFSSPRRMGGMPLRSPQDPLLLRLQGVIAHAHAQERRRVYTGPVRRAVARSEKDPTTAILPRDEESTAAPSQRAVFSGGVFRQLAAVVAYVSLLLNAAWSYVYSPAALVEAMAVDIDSPQFFGVSLPAPWHGRPPVVRRRPRRRQQWCRPSVRRVTLPEVSVENSAAADIVDCAPPTLHAISQQNDSLCIICSLTLICWLLVALPTVDVTNLCVSSLAGSSGPALIVLSILDSLYRQPYQTRSNRRLPKCKLHPTASTPLSILMLALLVSSQFRTGSAVDVGAQVSSDASIASELVSAVFAAALSASSGDDEYATSRDDGQAPHQAAEDSGSEAFSTPVSEPPLRRSRRRRRQVASYVPEVPPGGASAWTDSREETAVIDYDESIQSDAATVIARHFPDRAAIEAAAATQQQALAGDVVVGDAGSHGRGVFAARELATTDPITVLGHPTAAILDTDNDRTVQYPVDGVDINVELVGITAYINHSATPNLDLHPPHDEPQWCTLWPRRTIQPGEQLTFDYNRDFFLSPTARSFLRSSTADTAVTINSQLSRPEDLCRDAVNDAPASNTGGDTDTVDRDLVTVACSLHAASTTAGTVEHRLSCNLRSTGSDASSTTSAEGAATTDDDGGDTADYTGPTSSPASSGCRADAVGDMTTATRRLVVDVAVTNGPVRDTTAPVTDEFGRSADLRSTDSDPDDPPTPGISELGRSADMCATDSDPDNSSTSDTTLGVSDYGCSGDGSDWGSSDSSAAAPPTVATVSVARWDGRGDSGPQDGAWGDLGLSAPNTPGGSVSSAVDTSTVPTVSDTSVMSSSWPPAGPGQPPPPSGSPTRTVPHVGAWCDLGRSAPNTSDGSDPSAVDSSIVPTVRATSMTSSSWPPAGPGQPPPPPGSPTRTARRGVSQPSADRVSMDRDVNVRSSTGQRRSRPQRHRLRRPQHSSHARSAHPSANPYHRRRDPWLWLSWTCTFDQPNHRGLARALERLSNSLSSRSLQRLQRQFDQAAQNFRDGLATNASQPRRSPRRRQGIVPYNPHNPPGGASAWSDSRGNSLPADASDNGHTRGTADGTPVAQRLQSHSNPSESDSPLSTNEALSESNCPRSVDDPPALAEGVAPHSSRNTCTAATDADDETSAAPVTECSDDTLPSTEGPMPLSSRDVLTTATNADGHSASTECPLPVSSTDALTAVADTVPDATAIDSNSDSAAAASQHSVNAPTVRDPAMLNTLPGADCSRSCLEDCPHCGEPSLTEAARQLYGPQRRPGRTSMTSTAPQACTAQSDDAGRSDANSTSSRPWTPQHVRDMPDGGVAIARRVLAALQTFFISAGPEDMSDLMAWRMITRNRSEGLVPACPDAPAIASLRLELRELEQCASQLHNPYRGHAIMAHHQVYRADTPDDRLYNFLGRSSQAWNTRVGTLSDFLLLRAQSRPGFRGCTESGMSFGVRRQCGHDVGGDSLHGVTGPDPDECLGLDAALDNDLRSLNHPNSAPPSPDASVRDPLVAQPTGWNRPGAFACSATQPCADAACVCMDVSRPPADNDTLAPPSEVVSDAWTPLDDSQHQIRSEEMYRTWRNAMITTGLPSIGDLIVPLIHHSLHQCDIIVPGVHQHYGGLIADAAWARIFLSVGMGHQWASVLRIARATVYRYVDDADNRRWLLQQINPYGYMSPPAQREVLGAVSASIEVERRLVDENNLPTYDVAVLLLRTANQRIRQGVFFPAATSPHRRTGCLYVDSIHADDSTHPCGVPAHVVHICQADSINGLSFAHDIPCMTRSCGSPAYIPDTHHECGVCIEEQRHLDANWALQPPSMTLPDTGVASVGSDVDSANSDVDSDAGTTEPATSDAEVDGASSPVGPSAADSIEDISGQDVWRSQLNGAPPSSNLISEQARADRRWLAGDDFRIDAGDRHMSQPGGASNLLVPLVHYALFHCAVRPPRGVRVQRPWGGRVATQAWTDVFNSVGLLAEWDALLFVAVQAVRAMIQEDALRLINVLTHGEPPFTPMRADGYVGAQTQGLLLGARFDANPQLNAWGRASELLRIARTELRQHLAPSIPSAPYAPARVTTSNDITVIPPPRLTRADSEPERRAQLQADAAAASLLSRRPSDAQAQSSVNSTDPTTEPAATRGRSRGGRRGQARRQAARRQDTNTVASAQRVDLPPESIRWLRELIVDNMNPTPTRCKLPPRCHNKVGECYALCDMLTSTADDTASDHGLGRKLLHLMPRMLCGPIAAASENSVRIMRRRCNLFLAGQWSVLWHEQAAPLTDAERAQWLRDIDVRRGYTVDSRLDSAIRSVEDGRISKASQRLTTNGIQLDSDAAWTFFQSIYFARPEVDSLALTDEERAAYVQHLQRAPDPLFLQRTRAKCEERIRTAPQRVGSGPSGARYEHLKLGLQSSQGCESVLNLAMQLVEAADNWTDADRANRLTPLLKDDGGTRPVTSGEALTRVSGTAALQAEGAAVEMEMLPAHQLGFTQDGCLIAHASVRHLLAQHPHWACAALDEAEAFQHGSRDAVRRKLMAKFPNLIQWFEGRYGKATAIHFQQQMIDPDRTMEGFNQGDPFGSFCFALSRLDKAIELIRAHPGCELLWIIDDAYVLGPPELLLPATNDWQDMVRDCHGTPKLPKCKVLTVAPDTSRHPAIRTMADMGFDVLPSDGPLAGLKIGGHPVGSDAFCREFYMSKAAETEALVNALVPLANYTEQSSLQAMFQTLKYCAEPKMNYWLRAAEPRLIEEAARAHDMVILRCASRLLGPGDHLMLTGNAFASWSSQMRHFGHQCPSRAEFAELARLATAQLRLPLRCGGAGFISAQDTSATAYVSGTAAVARFLARDHISTPYADGGYGFRISASDFTNALCDEAYSHCRAVRVAWQSVAISIDELPALDSSLPSLIGCSDLRALATSNEKAQSKLSNAIHDGMSQQLIESCADVGQIRASVERKRLISCGARGATGFLRMMPSGYWTKCPNADFRTHLQFFLGLVLPVVVSAPPTCHCYLLPSQDAPSSLDVLRGLHDQVCRSNPKFQRHERPLRALQSATRLVGLGSSMTTCLMHSRRRLSDGSVDPSDTSKKQPDLAIYDYHSGGPNPTLIDLTITHPTSSTHISLPERVAAAAKCREQFKETKYADLADQLHFKFKAFGLETYGAMGPAAHAVITQICQFADATASTDTRISVGWEAPHLAEVIRQRISCALAIENARLLSRAADRRRRPQIARWAGEADARGDSIWDEETVLESLPAPSVVRRPRVSPTNGTLRAANVLERHGSTANTQPPPP
eukprot:COSAG01_NODE_406_length_17453_cov_83.218105_6_plen_3546_part_00